MTYVYTQQPWPQADNEQSSWRISSCPFELPPSCPSLYPSHLHCNHWSIFCDRQVCCFKNHIEMESNRSYLSSFFFVCNYFEIHPCCIYQLFILLYCPVVFHCMGGYTASCLSIHLLINIWVVSIFLLLLLQVKSLGFMGKFLHGHMFSFLLG